MKWKKHEIHECFAYLSWDLPDAPWLFMGIPRLGPFCQDLQPSQWCKMTKAEGPRVPGSQGRVPEMLSSYGIFRWDLLSNLLWWNGIFHLLYLYGRGFRHLGCFKQFFGREDPLKPQDPTGLRTTFWQPHCNKRCTSDGSTWDRKVALFEKVPS